MPTGKSLAASTSAHASVSVQGATQQKHGVGADQRHRCRHFLGLFPDDRPACAKGRDVRAWARRCNGGSDFGIALRLPCTRKISDERPLFDCPELDRRTQQEVDTERASLKARMDRFIKALPELNAMKRKMVKNRLSSAVATCPWCGDKNALRVGLALGVNNHMRANCGSCGEGFIE